MKEMVSTENIKQAVEGLKGMTELVEKGTTTLTNEVINLYIFYGIVGIIKAAVAFVVFGIIWKYLDVLTKAESLSAGVSKSLKTSALLISIIYFTAVSFPHVMDLGKAIVSPNLFLAEKGVELVKGK